ncbi:hypothetical protein E4U30_000522, partial [Claviceps sp. LM220 group G6]
DALRATAVVAICVLAAGLRSISIPIAHDNRNTRGELPEPPRRSIINRPCSPPPSPDKLRE